MLVTQVIFKNVTKIEYVHLINIQDTTTKSNFDIYQMIYVNIQQKLAKNQYYVSIISFLIQRNDFNTSYMRKVFGLPQNL